MHGVVEVGGDVDIYVIPILNVTEISVQIMLVFQMPALTPHGEPVQKLAVGEQRPVTAEP